MSSLRRWLAPLVALLVAFAQLGGAVHLSTVQHAVCVEHGEVVDVPRAEVAATPRRTALAAATEQHGHEHCTIHALVASPHAPRTPAFSPTLQSAAAARLVPCDPPRPIAILALAPKCSPPV